MLKKVKQTIIKKVLQLNSELTQENNNLKYYGNLSVEK